MYQLTILFINDRYLPVELSTNEILGTSGRDTLIGTTNRDRIIGGGGADILWGKEGSDFFVYRSITDAGDTIKDFEVGKDKVDLPEVLGGLGYKGFTPLQDGYLRLSDYSKGTVVSLDSDGSKGALSARPYVYLENVRSTQLTPIDFLPNSGKPPTIAASLGNDTGFSNSDRALSLGRNVFNVSTTDLAGNIKPFRQTIRRLPLTVNQAPIDLISSGNNVEENATGAVIGDITVVDPDPIAAFRNNIVTVSDDRFEVVNNNGTLQLKLKDGQKTTHLFVALDIFRLVFGLCLENFSGTLPVRAYLLCDTKSSSKNPLI